MSGTPTTPHPLRFFNKAITPVIIPIGTSLRVGPAHMLFSRKGDPFWSPILLTYPIIS